MPSTDDWEPAADDLPDAARPRFGESSQAPPYEPSAASLRHAALRDEMPLWSRLEREIPEINRNHDLAMAKYRAQRRQVMFDYAKVMAAIALLISIVLVVAVALT